MMKVILDVKNNKKIIFFFSISIIIINTILYYITSFFVKFPIENEEHISFKMFFLSGIFAPFFEETLMRGILQKYLENTKLERNIIYIIVAIIFSICHFKINFLPYFITSLFLSKAFDDSSHVLIVPILIHCNYNLFTMLIRLN